MKRNIKLLGIILAVLVTAFPVYSQSTDAALTTQSNVIRNETLPGGNTRARIADMYQGIIDSKVSIIAPRLKTTSTTGYIWTAIDNLGNGGWSASAGGNYSGASPTTTTVGGLVSGSSISGLSFSAILESILVPYIQPIFTSFGITGEGIDKEVGITISGSKTATWSITANSGVVPTIDIYNVTASTTLLAGTPNDGSQTFTTTTIQLNSNGATMVWRGIGNNTSPSGTFNSANVTTTARFYRFWAPSATSPANSAAVRALANSAFHTGAATFTLATGTTQTKFVVALPPDVTISSVIDTSALNANITADFILTGTVNVTDAGGTSRAYNIYENNIGAPYPSSHNFSVTTAN